MSFLDIAIPLAARGIPVVPLRPKTKIAFLDKWQDLATTNAAQIQTWATEYPDANCASVARAEEGGVWFFEIDKPEVVQRIESETNQKLPRTFRVRSRPGRGHYYFRQNAASIAMGNIAQGYVKGEDFSVRVDREYVVSPGSIHPNTGLPYEVITDADLTECPQWLIDWLQAQRQEKKSAPTDATALIISGSRNVTLTSIGGKLRGLGLDQQQIEDALLGINQKQCTPPLADEEVKVIAWSVSRYAVNNTPSVFIGGKPVGGVKTEMAAPPTEEETVQIPALKHPTFPHWAIEGTSLYEGLVKPVCDKNSRYPEFMFMPAFALLLNTIGVRVRVEYKSIIPSIFMVSIGAKGRVIKSSSVEDSIEYFRTAGLMEYATPHTKNADGKSLVWSAGSPEGFGMEMGRTGCARGILFYDELSKLAKKASIESSGMIPALLTLYESGAFQNVVKSKGESFSLPASTYCATLIACCTDKSFQNTWAGLAASTTGLEERFFFLYQPPTLKPVTPHIYVDTKDGAVETRKLIDKAVKQFTYKIDNQKPLADKGSAYGNRSEIRAEKFALGFAVDLGRDTIDDECIERGLALAEYDFLVKKYLHTYEADNPQAKLECSIRFCLMRNNGIMTMRELRRSCHAGRAGLHNWGRAIETLAAHGFISVTGAGTKMDAKWVKLLIVDDEEED